MAIRRPALLVFVTVLASMGAQYRTTNFDVYAPNQSVAQQIGQAAEYYRKEKAMQWIGSEMPPWNEPCPIRVTVTIGGAGGATSFSFANGAVRERNMHIEGPLDRLLSSVLPHEVTHTVFAYYFGSPLPRWADEGGAVLSEDDVERRKHDKMVREILNSGRAFTLRRLFAMSEYPHDVMTLYAEGFSVSDFLVGSSNRQTFLAFVAQGTREGWDRAVQTHYHYKSVEELEQAWINHLRQTRQQPPTQLAMNSPAVQGKGGDAPVPIDPTRRLVVHQTAPPTAPIPDDPPKAVYRGQAPATDQERTQRAGLASRPGYLPDPTPAARPAKPAPVAGTDPWQPSQYDGARGGPAVRLGAPQFEPPAPTPQPQPFMRSGWSNPNPGSPIGYPQ